MAQLRLFSLGLSRQRTEDSLCLDCHLEGVERLATPSSAFGREALVATIVPFHWLVLTATTTTATTRATAAAAVGTSGGASDAWGSSATRSCPHGDAR